MGESHASLYTAAGALVKTYSFHPGLSILDIGVLVPGCNLFNVAHGGTLVTKWIMEM